MPRTSLWLRVFVGLLIAVLPPILLLVGAVLLANSVLDGVDPNLVAVSVVAGTIAWAAILGVVYTRAMAEDLRSLLTLAERGEPVDDPEVGTAYRQLAAALDERNRQIATLAREAGSVPIDDAPRRVVEALVAAIRPVMGDATWRAAVLSSDDPTLLAPGIYVGSDEAAEPAEISDLERWASVSSAHRPPARLQGPWGAFAVVNVASNDRLRAILYAPWEGRPEPTPAEAALLALVGQHFGAAVEHALLYARVRSQADELDRLARIQADFLRGVTHDLQTPLTSIGALATELRADATLSDAAQTDLDTITHQAERLRRMVGQLLVASRLEAGVFTPQVEVFAVPALVERTWAALRADRPFEILVDGAPHLAIADPDRVEQVLWALLDNAVKYSPEGSPIEVRIGPEDGSLGVTVRDRGAGMDDETRQQAFEQFYRSAQARKLAPDGSGVGLYAARGLVEAMGGSVSLESSLGAGTSIRVRLPRGALRDQRLVRAYGCGRPQWPPPFKVPCKVRCVRWPHGISHVGHPSMKLLRRSLDRPTTRGQSMVEFAVILPLLALLLVLTIDVGRVFFGWVAVTNATRIGANEAARNPGPWADGGTDQRYYDRIAADLEAINCDADTNGDGVINGSDLPAPAFSNRVDTADPHEFGDHVEVSLSCDFSLITPLANALLGGGVTVGAEATFSVIGAKINGIPTPAEPPTSPCLPTERIVPNLIGMSVATARDRWNDTGFTGAFAPSDPAEDADTVTAQTATPAATAGSCLAYYAAMTVMHQDPTVCTGTEINVPALNGLTLTAARTTWANAGFTGPFTPAAGDDAKVVVTQTVSPSAPAGGCAPPTASVIVTFGDASDPPVATCTAPQLVRLTAARASADWTAAGFTGAFTTQPANKNNWIVKTQNLVGGQDYACTASVIVYLEKN